MLHQCFNRCDFTCLTAGKKPGKESLSWAAAWRRGGKGNQRASEEMTSRWTASHSLPFCCWDLKKKTKTTICTVIRIIWNLLKWVSYFVVLLQQGILFPDGNASEEAVRYGAAIVLLRKFNLYISDKVTSPWKHFWEMGGHSQLPAAVLYFCLSHWPPMSCPIWKVLFLLYTTAFYSSPHPWQMSTLKCPTSFTWALAFPLSPQTASFKHSSKSWDCNDAWDTVPAFKFPLV